MRSHVIFRILGSFLQIFAVMLALPVMVSLYYSESIYMMSGFIVASISSLVLGFSLYVSGDTDSPGIEEAMFSTVLGWGLAVMFGSIPFLTELGLYSALFESAAGLTTTGISMVLEPGKLSHSLLFWRSFMQWIGGLGILTFFIAVIRESGGVTRRLYSAEAHKTDSGSIRPSLTKSITELWKVYGFITLLGIAVYFGLGMSSFEALLHSFSAISTGGFSTQSGSIGAFSDVVQAATVPFMFVGGVNFVLLYRFLRADMGPLLKSSEFRLYFKVFLLVAILSGVELFFSGSGAFRSALDGAFQSATLISSTGYSTVAVGTFSVALQTVFLGVMFVGGSLGSTSGGLKIFRLKTLIELLKTKLRSYKLPESAVNEVKIDRELVEDSTVRTISVLFFTWILVIFASTTATLVVEDVSFMAALSGSISAAGNMGPVYMEGSEMVNLAPVTKIVWLVVMLAGRLEMLPLLAIFNTELFKETN